MFIVIEGLDDVGKPGANWEHVDLTNQFNDSNAEIKYIRD